MGVSVAAAMAISAGVSAYGAYKQSQASKQAAAQQEKASRDAMALNTSQYTAAQNQLAPYQQLGTQAASWLGANANAQPELNLPTYNAPQFTAPTQADLVADPAYRLRQTEDARAIQQSAAARGGGLGGNTMTALQDRSQALASEEYGNTFNRAATGFTMNADQAYKDYMSRYSQAMGNYEASQQPWNRNTQLAGLGMSAMGAGINAGQNTANANTGLLTGIGNAQAAGTVGSANAITQGTYGISDDMLTAYLASQYGKQPAAATGVIQPTTNAMTFNAPSVAAQPQPAYGTWGYGYGSTPWYQPRQQAPQRNPWDLTFG